MFWFIKQVLIVLLSFSGPLASIVDTPDTPQHTLIDLHRNEYMEGLVYYPFGVNLDRCMGSCNTLHDLSNKVCIPKSKILTKHISCECKCKFIGRKCNTNQKWNSDKCWCE